MGESAEMDDFERVIEQAGGSVDDIVREETGFGERAAMVDQAVRDRHSGLSMEELYSKFMTAYGGDVDRVTQEMNTAVGDIVAAVYQPVKPSTETDEPERGGT